MKIIWKAFYYDGKTAERHEVEVQLSPDSLEIKKTGDVIHWRYDEVAQTQGGHDGEPVRLERGEEALIIREAGFITSLKEMVPRFGSSFYGPEKKVKKLVWIPLAALLTLLIGFSVYQWAIPWAAEFAAENVPPSIEDRLGSTFVKGIKDVAPECSSPEAHKYTSEIVNRLGAAALPNPYHFKIYILKSKTVNAFALPGGHIVVFSGLIEKTKSPEELAGVLAHEMQHVLKKHTTKGMFQDMSTGLLLKLVFGDIQGASNAAHVFGKIRYTKTLEEEADKSGADLLIKANIDPQGMIDLFKGFGENGKTESELLKYISTHPLTNERVAYINKHVKDIPKKTAPLFPGVDWKKIKNSCSQ